MAIVKNASLLGVSLGLGLVACFAQSAAPDVTPGRIHHRTIKDRVDIEDGTSTSTNWSGYAVTGTDFTSATASWIVPEARNCNASQDQYSSFWVGIDGFASSSVEQTGTDSDCSGGSPSYYAWYEFYPNPSFTINNMDVRPGDKMSARVTFANNEFTVSIKDERSGQSFHTSQAVSGAARSSAEWIAEAPASNTVLPLADFGTVDFGDHLTGITKTDDATDSTTSGPIGKFGTNIQKITMATSHPLATPTALSTDGTSFKVRWSASQ
jgi:hypothetical protein